MKARGLTRLRWYCQVCQKACRDANGYKLHVESESHARQLAAVAGEGGQRAGKVVHDYSSQFQREFVILLSRRFGTRRVLANQVYQEYIQDRHHVHMNATRWVSLSEFVKYLGRAGIVRVEESELGWFISWIDNSPSALARQDALQKMNRQKADDEQRARKLLEEQIRNAKIDQNQDQLAELRDQGLRRPTDAPLKLSLSATPSHGDPGTQESSTSTQKPSTSTGSNVFSVRMNPLKSSSISTPPGSRPNPLKAPNSIPSASSSDSGTKRKPPPSHLGAAERIMMEEQSRKSHFQRKHSGESAPSRSLPGPRIDREVKRSRF
ncbi:hypothetical protein MYAM1_002156 [Malassezia yamatoensis]|uniref:C2H2-type domain-containing protein n=1 Tax=Malassezia yamatoensis TaxID=253288 RepID=A0AAJ5YXH0_9BASI|nr:hypothetical protein MYAM1_002156 [Malassezia yamatoensis]